MQTRHVPRIDRRYWFGIILASMFGTNLGDFYAHESGLGLGFGLLLLMLLFAAAYMIETTDAAAHELYYWLAIIIIRTGATNIADFLAYRVRVPAPLLVGGLAACMALLAWAGSARRAQAAQGSTAPTLGKTTLAKTGAAYWGAMLAAGVFGTVSGDICSHMFGQGAASLALGLMYAIVLIAVGARVATDVAIYWAVVALARTAGTCMGDWCAENRSVHLGLPLSTLLTGTAFVMVLTLWRGSPREARATA
jgi:uncharacterized membrane-anchored protein